MFAQEIRDGEQIEHPDPWLEDGTAWEFPRAARAATRCTSAAGSSTRDARQAARRLWHPAGEVEAKAYDMVVPGHGTERGQHAAAVEGGGAVAHRPARLQHRRLRARRVAPRTSTRTSPGCSTRTTARRPAASCACARSTSSSRPRSRTSSRATCDEHGTLANLADKVAIHLNDTHPAIGVAELMRLLCDEHGMAWAAAWAICRRVFSYTNHTLMPEALETWPVALMQQVLPRHLEIIFRINQDLLDGVAARRPGDLALLRAALADRRGRRAARAHGAPGDRRQPRRQRRLGAALRAARADHLRRLRRPLAGALHQRDQRRHAAALAGAGQPRPGGAARRTLGARLATRPRPARASARARPHGRTFAPPSWPSSSPTSAAWRP